MGVFYDSILGEIEMDPGILARRTTDALETIVEQGRESRTHEELALIQTRGAVENMANRIQRIEDVREYEDDSALLDEIGALGSIIQQSGVAFTMGINNLQATHIEQGSLQRRTTMNTSASLELAVRSSISSLINHLHISDEIRVRIGNAISAQLGQIGQIILEGGEKLEHLLEKILEVVGDNNPESQYQKALKRVQQNLKMALKETDPETKNGLLNRLKTAGEKLDQNHSLRVELLVILAEIEALLENHAEAAQKFRESASLDSDTPQLQLLARIRSIEEFQQAGKGDKALSVALQLRPREDAQLTKDPHKTECHLRRLIIISALQAGDIARTLEEVEKMESNCQHPERCLAKLNLSTTAPKIQARVNDIRSKITERRLAMLTEKAKSLYGDVMIWKNTGLAKDTDLVDIDQAYQLLQNLMSLRADQTHPPLELLMESERTLDTSVDELFEKLLLREANKVIGDADEVDNYSRMLPAKREKLTNVLFWRAVNHQSGASTLKKAFLRLLDTCYITHVKGLGKCLDYLKYQNEVLQSKKSPIAEQNVGDCTQELRDLDQAALNVLPTYLGDKEGTIDTPETALKKVEEKIRERDKAIQDIQQLFDDVGQAFKLLVTANYLEGEQQQELQVVLQEIKLERENLSQQKDRDTVQELRRKMESTWQKMWKACQGKTGETAKGGIIVERAKSAIIARDRLIEGLPRDIGQLEQATEICRSFLEWEKIKRAQPPKKMSKQEAQALHEELYGASEAPKTDTPFLRGISHEFVQQVEQEVGAIKYLQGGVQMNSNFKKCLHLRERMDGVLQQFEASMKECVGTFLKEVEDRLILNDKTYYTTKARYGERGEYEVSPYTIQSYVRSKLESSKTHIRKSFGEMMKEGVTFQDLPNLLEKLVEFWKKQA